MPVSPTDSPPPPPTVPSGPRGRAGLAWVVILIVVVVTTAMNHLIPEEDIETSGNLDRVMARIQAQYIVGVAEFMGDTEAIFGQAEAMNIGSVSSRQRFIALAVELVGPQRAASRLVELEALIEAERAVDPESVPMTGTDVAVGELLHELLIDSDGTPYDDSDEGLLQRVAALSSEEVDVLEDGLGWISGALLHPAAGDVAGREAFLAPTGRVLFLVVGGVGLAGLLGIAGLVALIVAGVMVARGVMRSGLGAAGADHRIYAETFAVWLPTFVLFSLIGGLIGGLLPSTGLIAPILGFLASLIALRWPVLRGVPWETVKHDVGFHPGPRPWLEGLVGAGGYIAALPLIAAGIFFSLILMTIQAVIAPVAAPFAPAEVPAHPIVLQIADSGWWMKLQVLLLASFAAPIVEETMFRGVLYRHLRGSSGRLGIPLSILVSGSISSFVFAAIHPQGWVAIPALMSLAFAFVLVREWRGSLLPAMVLHGVSNGLVMLGMFFVFGSA